MWPSRLVFALSFWVAVAPGSRAFGETVSVHAIVVRSYNTIGVPRSALKRAEATVQDLLATAGVEAEWRDCRTTASKARDVCNDVLNASEVIVRVVHAPPTVIDPNVLGYSHLDPYRGQGTLATVFADRIRVLAHGMGIDEGTLLGRAIAHELGHLLLGTLDHSATGLMRGDWHIPGRNRADWLFSAAEGARILNRLSVRVEPDVLAVASTRSSK